MGKSKKIQDINKSQSQNPQQAWLCSKCGYKLASLMNDSAALFYSREGREFIVTYDSMNTNCPKCNSIQEKFSPLLYIAIEETIKRKNNPYGLEGGDKFNVWNADPRDTIVSNIRVRAWGIKDAEEFNRAFPEEGMEMPNKERNQFLALLSENEKKAYRIMCDTFNGFVGNKETIVAIEKGLELPSQKEANLLYDKVLGKLREFKRENPDALIHR